MRLFSIVNQLHGFKGLCGVKSRVDSNSGEAIIEFDEDQVTLQKIKEVIREEGYEIK